MELQRTISADRRLHLDLPLSETFSPGAAQIVHAISGIDDECPRDHTPNAITLAAMEEGNAILKEVIPSALTIDLSRYKTREERKAAMRAALDAAEES